MANTNIQIKKIFFKSPFFEYQVGEIKKDNFYRITKKCKSCKQLTDIYIENAKGKDILNEKILKKFNCWNCNKNLFYYEEKWYL